MKRLAGIFAVLTLLAGGWAFGNELVGRADALDEAGNHAEALEIYLELEKQNPKDAETLHKISKQYGQLMDDAGSKAEKGRLGQLGLDYANRAVAADGKNAEAHLSVAICLGKIGFLQSPNERIKSSEKIRAAAQRAVDLDPKNDLAWHVLGRWNYELANLGGATKFFAQTFFGKLPDASNEQAVEALQRATDLNPNRLINQAELGRALVAAGQEAEAKRRLQQALAMEAKNRGDREAQDRARKALAGL